jgi:hypothetical protein
VTQTSPQFFKPSKEHTKRLAGWMGADIDAHKTDDAMLVWGNCNEISLSGSVESSGIFDFIDDVAATAKAVSGRFPTYRASNDHISAVRGGVRSPARGQFRIYAIVRDMPGNVAFASLPIKVNQNWLRGELANGYCGFVVAEVSKASAISERPNGGVCSASPSGGALSERRSDGALCEPRDESRSSEFQSCGTIPEGPKDSTSPELPSGGALSDPTDGRASSDDRESERMPSPAPQRMAMQE